jgi:hypothetical protein
MCQDLLKNPKSLQMNMHVIVIKVQYDLRIYTCTGITSEYFHMEITSTIF